MPAQVVPTAASNIESTLKGREVEGILDLYFYRPIGFRLAELFAKLKMTPAGVSLLAGIFGVITPLVLADLTRGTGRYNLALGAVATAQGIGAASSGLAAGLIVDHFGYSAAFLAASAVASAARNKSANPVFGDARVFITGVSRVTSGFSAPIASLMSLPRPARVSPNSTRLRRIANRVGGLNVRRTWSMSIVGGRACETGIVAPSCSSGCSCC